MKLYEQITEALDAIADPEKTKVLQSFFKTGKGQYGEGDIFIGIKVPENRKVAKEFFKEMTKQDYLKLMQSPIHEYRLCALIMLTYRYEKCKKIEDKKEIVDWYLQSLDGINNWDLVDTSCYKILGRYCYETQDSSHLTTLAVSEEMWHKRIAVVGTMHYVKNNSYELTKQLVLQNMKHPHDLMHKANGWLLREMGEQDEEELIRFLNQYATSLPRTSLRYAIEKLPEDQRKHYLNLKME